VTPDDAAALTRLMVISRRIGSWDQNVEFLQKMEQPELVDYCVFLLGALDAGLAQDAAIIGLPADQATNLLARLDEFEATP
jgi:hypothetical protein